MKIAIVTDQYVRIYPNGLGKEHDTRLRSLVSIQGLKIQGYKIAYR